MNRRIFLNIIIFGILTFYLLFSIVYRDMMDVHEADLVEADPWVQPFLIPKGWSVTRLEFGQTIIRRDEQGLWTIDGRPQTGLAEKIVANWTGLMVQDIEPFSEITTGQTVLVFVAETPQPIVFRLLMDGSEMHIYRLNDRRRFTLPAEIKDVVWLPDA